MFTVPQICTWLCLWLLLNMESRKKWIAFDTRHNMVENDVPSEVSINNKSVGWTIGSWQINWVGQVTTKMGTVTTHNGKNKITKRKVAGYLSLEKMLTSKIYRIKKLILTVKINIKRSEMETVQKYITLPGSISGHGLC